jgi:hypothetical protein
MPRQVFCTERRQLNIADQRLTTHSHENQQPSKPKLMYASADVKSNLLEPICRQCISLQPNSLDPTVRISISVNLGFALFLSL